MKSLIDDLYGFCINQLLKGESPSNLAKKLNFWLFFVLNCIL